MPGSPLAPTVDLGDLAARLLRRGEAGSFDLPAPPLLVGVPAAAGDPADLGFVALEVLEVRGRGHPVEVLAHTAVPDHWVALGSVAEGWAIPPDDVAADVDVDRARWRGPRPSERPDRIRAHTAELVSRDGRIALACALGDGPVEVHETTAGRDDGPLGAVTEAMLRALDLPTPPCPVPVVELWATLWLQAVLADAGPGLLSWPAVAARHPAVALLAGTGVALGPDELVPAGRALSRVWDWAELRRQTAAGRWGHGLVEPAVAARADDVMFARLVLGQLHPLERLVAVLDHRCSHDSRAALHDTLSAWGVDPDG